MWVGLLAGWLAVAGAEPVRVVVPDVRVTGEVDPNKVTGLTALIASEVARRADLTVVSGADIVAMVSFEEQKQLLGCTEASCFAELAGALGARFVVASEISRFGTSWLLSLALLDTREATAKKRLTKRTEDEAAVLDAASDGVRELLEAIPAPTEPAPAVIATPPADSPDYLRWSAIGGGALVGLGGAALYGVAWSKHGDPMLEDDARGWRRNAGIGLSMLVVGAAAAAASYWFWPAEAP